MASGPRPVDFRHQLAGRGSIFNTFDTESKTMPEAYDYSQLSGTVATAMRNHIAAAVDHGTAREDAAILASMAVMAGPIGTLAFTMGREMPTEAQVKKLIDYLLARLAELPAREGDDNASA